MDLNESFIDNNIDIFLQFAKDLDLKGDIQQCIIGDQATCVTIRGGRRRRINIDDITPIQRLQWAKENPGDIHFLWECLRIVFILLRDTSEPGSLVYLKLLVRTKGKLTRMQSTSKHLMNSYNMY